MDGYMGVSICLCVCAYACACAIAKKRKIKEGTVSYVDTNQLILWC